MLLPITTHGKTRGFLLPSSLALVTALALLGACSSSSGSPSSDTALTCKGGASPGPESVECDTCGMTNCATKRSAVTAGCATYATCLEACTCTSADTCSNDCFTAASSTCQASITAYADCEKETAACDSECTQN